VRLTMVQTASVCMNASVPQLDTEGGLGQTRVMVVPRA
jgi:hypothetical protein